MQRRDAMGIGLTILIILLIVYAVSEVKKEIQHPRPYTTIRCPTCDEEARVYGNEWECTWCGDSGKVEWK